MAPAPLATPGHRVRWLRDGREAFPAMLAAIDAAREVVHLETFIFATDATGQRFAEALGRAVERGVMVSVLFDAVGSWAASREFFATLRARGVRVRSWRPLSLTTPIARLVRRDHRKLLVVDGRVAWLGGINLADAWAPREHGGQGWRDDAIEVEGPVARELASLHRSSFLSDGEPVGTEVGSLFRRLLARFGRRSFPRMAPRQGELPGRVHVGVLRQRRAIHRAYLAALNGARQSVLLANAYFVPDRRMLRALELAAQRGVEVQLLLPAHTDHDSVVWAGRATYGRLLDAGVRIAEWGGEVLHAKSAVVDGRWVTTGSFNLDRWSLRFSQELNVFVEDEALGGEVEAHLRRDLARAREVTAASWRERPWGARLLEQLAWAFRALL